MGHFAVDPPRRSQTQTTSNGAGAEQLEGDPREFAVEVDELLWARHHAIRARSVVRGRTQHDRWVGCGCFRQRGLPRRVYADQVLEAAACRAVRRRGGADIVRDARVLATIAIADSSTIAVGGEIDVLTAPLVRTALAMAIEHGTTSSVVVDLVGLEFMDAAGLRVFADAAAALAAGHRTLSIRSAPAQTSWMLSATHLDDIVDVGDGHRPQPLGPEQQPHDRSSLVAGAYRGLAADISRVGSVPANTVVVDAALRLVTELASATVEGADGVSVSLERHGTLRTVASSNDTVLRMDDHQYDTGEGPCISAATAGHWFHIESLAREDRWPSFVPLAVGEGIASILSTPLIAADRPIGALNIYSNTDGAFGPRQQELAALFATHASGVLADAGADVGDEALGARILDALLSREAIARAQGVLMAQQSVTGDAAAALLHRDARTAAVPLVVHAATVLASTHVDAGHPE